MPTDRLIEVRITKGTLFLTESELLHSLPEAVLVAALQRGKAIMRSRRLNERQGKRGVIHE